MSDETKRVIFWVLGIALFMVFYLILMGVVWIVKGAGGVDYMLNVTGYIFIGILIFAALMAFRILDMRSFRMGASVAIEAQQSDDRGEIARVAMNQMGKFDVKVAQVAGRLAQQQTNAIMRASQRQETTPVVEADSWWEVPQLEDNGA